MKQGHADGQDQTDLTRTLICRLRQGDERAASLLDAVYRTRLLRFSQGYLGNRSEAEDVVQDVFYRVLASDVVPERFRAWVYRITRNRCLDLLRARLHRGAEEKLAEDLQLPAGVTGKLTRMVRQERQERLHRMLKSLPLHQQEVIRLRYAENLSRPEIAEVLDLAESVVKSRIFEGLEALRRQAARPEKEL